MNQIIQFMLIHTRQAHPQTRQAPPGPSSLLLGSAFVRPILALTILIALIAVGFGIKEIRDSRIATEELRKVMEVEGQDAKERTNREARDARERAEKETQESKERAEKERVLKEIQAAKERAEKDSQIAKEKEAQIAKEKGAQEKKDNARREALKVDFENFRNQDLGEQGSITVQEMNFLDLNEFHRCKYIEDVDEKQYNSTIENLAELMGFSKAQEKEIILAQYSKSLVNVVEDFKYTEIGIYTYGKYQTLRRPNGNLDITFAMHAFKWDINQDQLDTKDDSNISDKPGRDVAKLKSGAKLKESERKAWKNAFRAEAIGLFQKDCPPQLLAEIGLQEKERKEKEKHKHDKVVKDLDGKQREVNNLKKEIKNLKEGEAKKDKEKSKDLHGKQEEINDLKKDIKNLKEEEAKKEEEKTKDLHDKEQKVNLLENAIKNLLDEKAMKQMENEKLKKKLDDKWF